MTQEELKEKQLEIIQKYNPMLDDYHIGIRTVEDIKTWEEAMRDNESFFWGDFSLEDAEEALKTGKITVYSSKPIQQGTFVSTSYNQARDYAGSGKIYEKRINLNEVAWINGDEGQYSKVNQRTLSEQQEKYFKDTKIRDEDNNLQVFYHATNAEFDTFDKDFIGAAHGASFGDGFYFSSEPIPAYGNNIEVYLDVKQPCILDLNNEESVLKFGVLNDFDIEDLKCWIDYYGGNIKGGIGKTIREYSAYDLPELRNKGYDGLIILNTSVGMHGQTKQFIGKEVLVFEPNQIKSIDNLYPTKDNNFKNNATLEQMINAASNKVEAKHTKDAQEKVI